MIACNVKQMSKEVSSSFSADDVAKIRNFSRTRSKVRLRSLCSSKLVNSVEVHLDDRPPFSHVFFSPSSRMSSISWLAPWLPASTATTT